MSNFVQKAAEVADLCEKAAEMLDKASEISEGLALDFDDLAPATGYNTELADDLLNKIAPGDLQTIIERAVERGILKISIKAEDLEFEDGEWKVISAESCETFVEISPRKTVYKNDKNCMELFVEFSMQDFFEGEKP